MPTSFEGGNQQVILGPSLKTESDGSFSAGTRSHFSRRVIFSRSISPGAKPPAAVNGSNLLSDHSVGITPLSAIIKIPGAKPPVAATDGHSCGIPGGAPSSASYPSPGAKPPAAVNGSNLLSDRSVGITPLSAIIKIPGAMPPVAATDGHSCGIPGGVPSSASYPSPGAKPPAAVMGAQTSVDILQRHPCGVSNFIQIAPSILHMCPLTQALPRWRSELSVLLQHFDRQPDLWGITRQELISETAWVLDGFENGFRVISDDQLPPPYIIPNYGIPSVHLLALENDTNDDLLAHRILEVDPPGRWLTPIFIKEEGVQLDGKEKIRVIRDYSINNPALRGSPLFRSVNDAAWHQTFKMMSLDDALHYMRPRCFMAKIDIKKAYRTVPVHPSNWEVLGFRVGRRSFIDVRLPFGLKNAPEIFTRITNLVRHMMRCRGINAIVVYIDDFWISADTEADCRAAYDCLLELLRGLGFTVSEAKCVPPTQDLVFLGTRLVSDSLGDGSGVMQASIPPEKLVALKALCASFLPRRSITLHQAQSLLGKLASVARVVFAGRAFVRRICKLITDASATARSELRITRAFLADLHFWIKYADHCNGHALILNDCALHTSYFCTDASLTGIGGFLDGDFFHARLNNLGHHATAAHRAHRKLWPGQRGVPTHIGYFELFAIWWSLVLWGPRLQGLHIRILIDNENAVFALRKGAHKNPFFMHLIRQIYWIMASVGFRLYPTYIRSVDNTLTDILSREGPTSAFWSGHAAWKAAAASTQRRSVPERDTRMVLFPRDSDHRSIFDLAL